MPSREWVSIDDPTDDHRRYTFDVSFLLSSYTCIYGRGCEGIHPGEQDPALGCCTHGAYLNDDDEQAFYDAAVRDVLDPSTMQFHETALRDGIWETDEDDEIKTRTIDGGCLFANRTGFPGGEGCALHAHAVRVGEHFADWKPTVCWQVPLHRTIEETTANDGETLEIHLIAAYERGHWGEGGAEFDWWCLDDDTAFVSPRPLYREMEGELRRMVGDAIYDELAVHLDSRRRQRNVVQFLPTV